MVYYCHTNINETHLICFQCFQVWSNDWRISFSQCVWMLSWLQKQNNFVTIASLVAEKDRLQCRFGFICKSWRCGRWLSGWSECRIVAHNLRTTLSARVLSPRKELQGGKSSYKMRTCSQPSSLPKYTTDLHFMQSSHISQILACSVPVQMRCKFHLELTCSRVVVLLLQTMRRWETTVTVQVFPRIRYWKLDGGLEHFSFFHILGIIIPIDFHTFQRGWNHQPAQSESPVSMSDWRVAGWHMRPWFHLRPEAVWISAVQQSKIFHVCVVISLVLMMQLYMTNKRTCYIWHIYS